MRRLSPEEEEARKRAIFEGMSERMKRRILQRGYQNWDPFQPPRDPIDLRVDGHRHTAAMLIRKFLEGREGHRDSPAFAQGAWEICLGIFEERDRYLGMFEFAKWYLQFQKEREAREGEGR